MSFSSSYRFGALCSWLLCLSSTHAFFLPQIIVRPIFSLQESVTEKTEETSAASLRSITFSDLQQSQEPQLLGNFLMELGACSTSIVDADRGTDQEKALFDEFDAETMTRTAVTTHVWDHW